MDAELTRDDVRRALAGDGEELDRLVRALTPVIQARVARGLLLWRSGPAAGRDVRQEIADLVQEVFLALFTADGKVLRSWRPGRGLSFENFVGLVAERRTASVLRSGKRSPWKEDPTLAEELDATEPHADPEEAAAAREVLNALLGRLAEELTPLGRRLFDLLFLQDLSVREVGRRTDMTPDAIYAWRSRLRRQAHKLLRELSEEETTPRKPL